MHVAKAAPKRLIDIYFRLIGLGCNLHLEPSGWKVEAVRARILEWLDEADHEAEAHGYSKDAIADARYAVAAFLDEMILTSPSPTRSAWASRTLQFEFFKTQEAGIGFFRHLETVRRALPPNVELLELYHLLLACGFQGQYRVQGREGLRVLIDGIAKELEGKRPPAPALSASGKRPEEAVQILKPDWMPWIVTIAGAASVAVVYLVLRFLIASAAGDVAALLEQLGEP